MSRFTNRTCNSLTPQQLASLDLSSWQSLSASERCRWSQGDATFDVTLDQTHNPLVLDYQEANNGFFPVFEPMVIGGFPALKRQTGSKPPVYMCTVSVTTGPSRGITIIGMSNGSAIDWCAKGIAAAGFIVANLGG